jgi:hypothetical protein
MRNRSHPGSTGPAPAGERRRFYRAILLSVAATLPALALPATWAANPQADALATLRVDADSLRITLDLPKAALESAGVLDLKDPGDLKSAVVNRDSLAGYLRYRVFAIQDDGLLVLQTRRVTDSMAANLSFAQVELVAGLLDTYTHIGFASGLFRELAVPIPTQVHVEWRGAKAEFEATQAVQFIEPPAKGATTLELPGREASAH